MRACPSAPVWFDDVAGWLVTFSEARFGLCRMLLWMRCEDGEAEADVVMPLRYTEFERSLPDDVRGDDRPFFAALLREGLVPAERPGPNTPAPALVNTEELQ
jgi:hypothetical protein